MQTWPNQIALSELSGTGPLFVQIAQAIADRIRNGRLRPDQALPSTRRLASQLGVNRNTVVAAYEELASGGWVETRVGTGTFVSPQLPKMRRRNTEDVRVADSPGFKMITRRRQPMPVEASEKLLMLSSGTPDLRLVPTEIIARAYRRNATRRSAQRLGYGDPRGALELRRALADMVRETRGIPATPDDVLVTRGSQHAISLAAQCLLSAGDEVAVEHMGYPDAWAAISSTGASLRAIPTDGDGLVVEKLAARVATAPVQAVYLTPHHHYPTLAVLSQARRLALMELARRHRFAIFEDDYDSEFHFSGRPVMPLASRDRSGQVIYIGTLSKVLAPGLRIGFAIAPRALLRNMSAQRQISDRQGDHVMECAIAELIADGELQRHARKMRRIYLERRSILIEELRSKLGDYLEFEIPPGGLALWVRVSSRVPVDELATSARRRGAFIETAKSYRLDGRPRQAIRLGFANLEPKEIRQGVAILAASAKRIAS